MAWIDRGQFFELEVEQGSQLWLQSRVGRQTGNPCYAITHPKYTFSTPAQTLENLMGAYTPPNEAMAHGTKWEPIVRDEFERRRGVTVRETGLCVPKDDYGLGASLDGYIEATGEIIEIKCPKRMYQPIKQLAIDQLDTYDMTTKELKKYITKSHLYQMYQNLRVVNSQLCHYVVCAYNPDISEDAEIAINRIRFDADYWNNKIYPLLKGYRTQILQPEMIKRGVRRMDPDV